MPSPFPLFFSFSAPFKNSNSGEKVGNCLRFGTGGGVSVSIHYCREFNIFPHVNNGRSSEKKFLAKQFARAISVHCRDFEHAYVY